MATSSAISHPTSPPTKTSPWNIAVSSQSSPKLQEILDEELARQINALELRHAARQAEQLSAAEPTVALDGEEADGKAVNPDVEDEMVNDSSDEDDLYDNYDEADEAGDLFVAKTHRVRSIGSQRRGVDLKSTKLELKSPFDKRTQWVLGRIAGRGILTSVDIRVHSSLKASIHHGRNDVSTDDNEDELVAVHCAVKILKSSSIGIDKTSESLVQSNRPANEAMAWMSMRRQLKVTMQREFSAQSRAVACGVRAPMPYCGWEHVIISAFIGHETTPAPLLRDVVLRRGQLAQAYVDLLCAMRTMYQQAKFVHGGLNEYSILYHDDACWIIDFSNAVDTCHEEHAEVLNNDINAIHTYFAGKGMPKATKHDIGLLNQSAMHEIITQKAVGKALSGFPWLKPYLYKKTESP